MLILELNFMFILSMSPSDTEVHSPVESNEAGLQNTWNTAQFPLPASPLL